MKKYLLFLLCACLATFSVGSGNGSPILYQAGAQLPNNLNTVAVVTSSGTATLYVSYYNSNGVTDNVGINSSVTLTAGTAALSLPRLMVAGGFAIPSDAVGAVVQVAAGTAYFNNGGTPGGVVGAAGNGFAVSTDAPSATSPLKFTVGQMLTFGLVPVGTGASGSTSATISGTANTNGATIFTTWSSVEGSTAATVTPATLALGTPGANPVQTFVTNAGPSDIWVSTISGGHTYLIPAGEGPQCIPTASNVLYVRTVVGTATVYAIQGGR